MGKSALVQRFTDGLVESGSAMVLSGRCYERESVPFKALDSLMDGLTRNLRALPSNKVEALLPVEIPALARVFPVLSRVEEVVAFPRRAFEIPDPQEVRRRAFAAFRELAQRIVDRRPLVLWIDDLQWGDVDSVAMLSELLRPPQPPPFLLILSYGAEEATASPFLLALGDRRHFDPSAIEACTIEVGPLAPADAEHLFALVILATGQPALAWLRGGDSAAARARTEDVSRRWTQRDYHNQHYWSTLSLAHLDLYEGKGTDALRRIDRDWHRADRAFVFQVQIVFLEALHLRGSACLAAATERSGTARAGLLKRAERDAKTLDRHADPYAPACARFAGKRRTRSRAPGRPSWASRRCR